MQFVIVAVIFRIFDILCAFFAQKLIPFLGFFPYKEVLLDFHLPFLISSFANFDGVHYLLIAKNGYSQYEQAFFPFYPVIIHIVSYVFSNQLIAALIVSYASFITAIFFLAKYVKKQNNAFWTILFLITFPTSFFFGTVYTESLFLLLFILMLFFLEKKNHYASAFFAFLASLTRLIGVFLCIPLVINSILSNKKNKKNKTIYILQILLSLSPLFGLFCYSFYLYMTTGDFLFFFNSQPIFGANRSTHMVLLPQVIVRYIKIIFFSSHNFQYYISFFEFLVFLGIFIVLLYEFWFLITHQKNKNFSSRLGLNLFSLTNLLLPSLTGTFSSVPRYALFSLSFFMTISQIKSNIVKSIIAFIFLILHIVLLGFFIQGYFVS